jgi:hypothetical protein
MANHISAAKTAATGIQGDIRQYPANSGRSDLKSRCPKADNRVLSEGLWKTANSRGNVCLQCYEPKVSMRQVASRRSVTKIRASLQPRGA